MKELNAQNVYEVSWVDTTTDQKHHIGYFTNRNDALRAVRSQSTLGAESKLVNIDIKIFESYDEYSGEERQKIRASALAKLTAEERKVLGLE